MPPPDPEQNKLLACLPAKERTQLTPLLQWVEYDREAVLIRADTRPDYVYFPVTLVTALMALGRSGATTALALVGREGGLGLVEMLAGEKLAHDAVVLVPGGAYRLPASRAGEALAPARALLPAALNHGHSLMTQIAQTAFCNLHHPLDQRLCRWLLSIAYRVSDRQLRLTEAQIADVLGVRRESVSLATVRLQEEGLIQHHRGTVEILDRDRLEAKACECLPVFPWHPYPARSLISVPGQDL